MEPLMKTDPEKPSWYTPEHEAWLDAHERKWRRQHRIQTIAVVLWSLLVIALIAAYLLKIIH